MPAPVSATYSAAAKVAAHTSFRDLIDVGAGTGSIKIRNSADLLLSTCPLLDPCGTVDGTTGQLTFSIGARDEEAAATGTAAYGEICDVAGAVHLALPAEAGAVAVANKIVLTTLSVVIGGPVEMVSATIG